MNYYIDDELISSVNLVSDRSIEKKNIFSTFYYLNGLIYLEKININKIKKLRFEYNLSFLLRNKFLYFSFAFYARPYFFLNLSALPPVVFCFKLPVQYG